MPCRRATSCAIAPQPTTGYSVPEHPARWNAVSIPVPRACVARDRDASRRALPQQGFRGPDTPPVTLIHVSTQEPQAQTQAQPAAGAGRPRPPPGHPHRQAPRPRRRPELPRHPRRPQRHHRRPRRRSRLPDPDRGRQRQNRRHRHPPARQGQPRRPGGGRVPLAERQRRDDRRLLDRRVRHLPGPDRDHQHPRRRDRARRRHRLDEPVPRGPHRRLAAPGRGGDLGRLPQRHQRPPRQRGHGHRGAGKRDSSSSPTRARSAAAPA